MRTKQRPLIQELPLIVLGFAVVGAGALAATAVLEAARILLHVTRLDQPLTQPHTA